MITAAQLRAARVLLGIDQRRLAELSGLSVPTIQRMEASETMVRGNVDSLVKLITAIDDAGIELIDEAPAATAGDAACGSRPVQEVGQQTPSERTGKQSIERNEDAQDELSDAPSPCKCHVSPSFAWIGRSRDRVPACQDATAVVYGATLTVSALRSRRVATASSAAPHAPQLTLPVGLPWLGAHFRLDALASFFLIVVNLGGHWQVSTALAMAVTTRRRTGCCRSFPPFSPA